MKSILSFTLLFLFSLCPETMVSQDIIAESRPSSVMLYLSGARVISNCNVQVSKGIQTLTINNLSNFIDQNSIQLKTNSASTILSVNYRLNFLNPQNKKEHKILTDSIAIYKKNLARVSVQKQSLIEEIAMLQANRTMGNKNTTISTTEIAKMADFFRNRMNETGKKKLEMEEQENRVMERISMLEEQIKEIQVQSNNPTGEIVVSLSNPSAGKAEFILSYIVSNCGWTPIYEIKVKDISSPCQVIAKANIFQGTGQDWQNINLTLSTGNPSHGNSKPELLPWTIYISDPLKTKRKSNNKESYDLMAPGVMNSSEMNNNSGRSMADHVSVDNQNSLNSEFQINIPINLPSNGKENFVEIQKYETKAIYRYFAVPKLDKDAFLISYLTDWGKPELLSGEAVIYFEDDYIGKSWLNTQLTDDTLSIGLGRDNSIMINRKEIKNYSEKNFSGSHKKITRAYETEIKNLKKKEINLEIEDQIPLSSNEEISIELIDSDNAKFDKETGKLKWIRIIKPGETIKIGFTYSVRYPKKHLIYPF